MSEPAVRVWDLPIRLFHWSLALLVGFSLITGEFRDDFGMGIIDWHARSGYAILTLVIFRLLWGFLGGTHARFSSFVRGPRAVAAYLRGSSAVHVGHNPLGGWSTALMLASLALQAGTGLFISNEDLGFDGPLARHVSSHTGDRLQAIHQANSVILLVLVALHLAAIAFYFFAKRDNLVRPMLTGVKRLAAPSQSGGHPLRGALVLAIAAAAVWFIVNRL